MMGLAELIVIAGVVFILLGLVILILVIRMYGRRREREIKRRQLDSVYSNRDRRGRGN